MIITIEIPQEYGVLANNYIVENPQKMKNARFYVQTSPYKQIMQYVRAFRSEREAIKYALKIGVSYAFGYTKKEEFCRFFVDKDCGFIYDEPRKLS